MKRMELSKRAQGIEPSVTLAASAKAKALKAAGKDVLSLTVGEPDFPTPKNIQEAAKRAIDNGTASYYTATPGIPALRQAVVDSIQTNYGLTYTPSQTIVTNGAKFALYLLFQVLLNEGDEVIIPTPYWVSYSEQVKLAGGVPVFVEALEENDYKVTVPQLEQVRSKKTKAILLNSPSNPTGMIYTKDELQAIGDWAVAHQFMIVADDIYGQLVYGEAVFTPMATISEAIRKQTIIINGVSKTYAMTGWRIGFAVGEQTVIQAMIDLASQASSNPAAVSQYAALEALTGPQDSVETMRQAFEERMEKVYVWLKDIPGMTVRKPQGAFYLFPNVRETMAICGYHDVDDFVEALLEEANVAVVTGKGFGAPDNIRLSYATDLATLEEAVKRIKNFVEKKQQK